MLSFVKFTVVSLLAVFIITTNASSVNYETTSLATVHSDTDNSTIYDVDIQPRGYMKHYRFLVDSGAYYWKHACMDLKDGRLENGALVQLWDCNYAMTNDNQVWVWEGNNIMPYGKMQPGFISMCLDAGEAPWYSGRQIKIWQCYPGLSQQQWSVYYVGSWMGFKLRGTNLCIDVPGAIPWDGSILQLYTCYALGVTQGFETW